MTIEEADRLADQADGLSRLEPRSERALRAARESVTAAQSLAGDGVPGGRSRLARALWRLAAAQSGSEPEAAAETAARCWTVCRSLLDRPDPADEPGVLEARIAYWLGVLLPVLSQARREQEVAEAMDRVARAALAADAVNGARATARLNLFAYTAAADDFARARMAGRWAQTAEPLARTIDHAAGTVRIFERHAADGPYEASEFAQALLIASRLMTVAGDLPMAASLLDRAEEVAAGFADMGPAFRAQTERIRQERDGLSGYAPRTP